MKCEALYSAVLSAAPAVLIGFVLEVRHLISRIGTPPRNSRWMLHGTVISTSLSAAMSLMALSTKGDFAESPYYALESVLRPPCIARASIWDFWTNGVSGLQLYQQGLNQQSVGGSVSRYKSLTE